jgi:hypothetical protein
MEQFAIHFVLHGVIVLATGLVGGLLFARAIKSGHNEVAWRVVHSGGCSAGVMLVAISSSLRYVALPLAGHALLGWTLIGGTYALVIGMVVAAATGHRGLSGGGSIGNRFVNYAYLAGTVATLVGCGLLLVGILRTLVAS